MNIKKRLLKYQVKMKCVFVEVCAELKEIILMLSSVVIIARSIPSSKVGIRGILKIFTKQRANIAGLTLSRINVKKDLAASAVHIM